MDRENILNLISEYIVIMYDQSRIAMPASQDDTARYIRLNKRRMDVHEKIAEALGMDLVETQEALWNANQYGVGLGYDKVLSDGEIRSASERILGALLRDNNNDIVKM